MNWNQYDQYEGTPDDVEVGTGRGRIKLSDIKNSFKQIMVNVKDFGAKGDRDTDDTSAIQRAIDSIKPSSWDALTAPMGGIVLFPPGTYRVTDSIVLPAYVTLKGAGMFATELFLSDGTNKDIIKTTGYDSFVGSGKSYYDTTGVPTGFGIEDMLIQGNKFNNTSGGGIAVYGYNYRIKNVAVIQSAGAGFTSRHETGLDVFVENKVKLQETSIVDLFIYDCKGHGLDYFGPTDARVDGVYIGKCAGDAGAWIQSSIDVGLLHVYACNQDNPSGNGVVVKGNSRFENLISESNYGAGVFVDTFFMQASNIQLYRNCRSGGNYNMVVSAASGFLQAGNVEIRLMDVDKGGISVAGQSQRIGRLTVYGDGVTTYTKTGLFVAGTAHYSFLADVYIKGMKGTGATGIALNQGGSIKGLTLTGVVEDCTTGANPGAGTGGGQSLELKIILTGVQTAVASPFGTVATDKMFITSLSAGGAWSTLTTKVPS